jgi:hypothetical protein
MGSTLPPVDIAIRGFSGRIARVDDKDFIPIPS